MASLERRIIELEASLEKRIIELEEDYDVDLSHIAADACCEVCDDELIEEIKFELAERLKADATGHLSENQNRC